LGNTAAGSTLLGFLRTKADTQSDRSERNAYERGDRLQHQVLAVVVSGVQSQQDGFDDEKERRGFNENPEDGTEGTATSTIGSSALLSLPDAPRHETGGDAGLDDGHGIERQDPVREAVVKHGTIEGRVKTADRVTGNDADDHKNAGKNDNLVVLLPDDPATVDGDRISQHLLSGVDGVLENVVPWRKFAQESSGTTGSESLVRVASNQSVAVHPDMYRGHDEQDYTDKEHDLAIPAVVGPYVEVNIAGREEETEEEPVDECLEPSRDQVCLIPGKLRQHDGQRRKPRRGWD